LFHSHLLRSVFRFLRFTRFQHQEQVAKIVTAHGAIDFLAALQTFLCKNLPHTTIVPCLHDHFDVYRQVVIIAPPDRRVSDVSKR
ncbi:uncharacterized protein EDB91DRAFT_1092226, partial [Suillus paluster]|uniref:uncharacterized protein n=1 Tax=Suillus paluster TaxID=48578 RepID=UPI001B88491E